MLSIPIGYNNVIYDDKALSPHRGRTTLRYANYHYITDKFKKMKKEAPLEGLPQLSIDDIERLGCLYLTDKSSFILYTHEELYLKKKERIDGLRSYETPRVYVALKDGRIILGRKENNNFYLGSFLLPSGCAIYILPDIIHCYDGLEYNSYGCDI